MAPNLLVRSGALLALAASSAFALEGTDCVKIDKEYKKGLEDDHLFTYKQNNDILSPNSIHLLIQKIAVDVIPGVKRVGLDYKSEHVSTDHHLHVQTHELNASVVHGDDITTCYTFVYEVEDVDECSNTDTTHGARWVSQCHPSSECKNTIGSYECHCTGTEFGQKIAGTPTGICGGKTTTEDCCSPEFEMDCKANFVCHDDNCAHHTCGAHSTCVPLNKPNEHYCECNDGYHADPPGSNNCVPTDYCNYFGTNTHKCPDGCSCVSDLSRFGYICPPKAGFRNYTEVDGLEDPKRLDPGHICVRNEMPVMQVKGEKSLTLTQGDSYAEKGVDITHPSSALVHLNYETDYSMCMAGHKNVLLAPFVKECGQYTVNYHLKTMDVDMVETREVNVVDVNECTYGGDYDDFKHLCDEEMGARCANTPEDCYYECICPYEGYEPAADTRTSGIRQGCVDRRKPIIKCKHGVSCVMRTIKVVKSSSVFLQHPNFSFDTILHPHDDATPQWIEIQLEEYFKDYKLMLSAEDRLYDNSIVDLTDSIEKLRVTQTEDMNWELPFKVSDANGNVGEFMVKINVEIYDAEKLESIFEKAAQNGLGDKAVCDEGDLQGELDAKTKELEALKAKLSSSVTSLSGDVEWTATSYLRLALTLFVTFLIVNSFWALFRAAQCLFVPATLKYNEKAFVYGMDTLLLIQSFGMISPSDRERVIEFKWEQLNA